MRRGGVKSFVDDLVLGRGVVISRAATSLRSVETQPLTRRFVRIRRATISVQGRGESQQRAKVFAKPAARLRRAGRAFDRDLATKTQNKRWTTHFANRQPEPIKHRRAVLSIANWLRTLDFSTKAVDLATRPTHYKSVGSPDSA